MMGVEHDGKLEYNSTKVLAQIEELMDQYHIV